MADYTLGDFRRLTKDLPDRNDKYILKQTCFACPEQYDLIRLRNGYEQKIGYFRLRHGGFRVDQTVDVSKEDTVFYSDESIGDGIFTSEERDGFLQQGIDAVMRFIYGRNGNGFVLGRDVPVVGDNE